MGTLNLHQGHLLKKLKEKFNLRKQMNYKNYVKVLILILITNLFTLNVWGQNSIDVVESTFKVGGLSEQEFYYGFAEGDQVIINFEEVNGKELKEFEIIEFPATSKFMDYKTKSIANKILTIQKSGIYKFRFNNTALGGRVCKWKIQRIPSSEKTKNFNTSVYWKTVYDTTYTPVEENYLVKSDTIITTVVDQIAKISSQSAINGNPNKTVVDFTLPENTVSWSYYIGVGNEGKQAYEQAKEKFITSAAASVSKIPGYGSMAALALYGLNYFNKVQGKDNVKYWFISDWNSVLLFNSGQAFYQYKQGDVINDASQMKVPVEGKVFIGLMNDNVVEPIDVMVKVSAITMTQQWGRRVVKKMNVSAGQVAYLNN